MDIFSGKSLKDDIDDYYGRVGSKSYEVICDMDEVLVNITPSWVGKALLNEKIVNCIGERDIEFMAKHDLTILTLSRTIYRLSEWLDLDEECTKLFESIYFSNGDTFYDNLEPTTFGQGLISTIEKPSLRTVHILTHVGSIDNSSKRRFIEKYFSHKKFNYIEVPLNTPKSKVINDLDIKYVSFVDDSLHNIMDVLKNTNSYTCEFSMPRLGYNEETPELIELVESKFARFGYYERVL
jgi:hypothetical protein